MTYKGFSTVNALSQKNFKLTDYELIKQDLLNSINTSRGERVMQPYEGTTVWNIMFDPFTDALQTTLQEEFMRIINSDPRVKFESMVISSANNEVSMSIEISYVDTNQLDNMALLFRAGATTAIMQ
jgi:phage baseplate assembly protein W